MMLEKCYLTNSYYLKSMFALHWPCSIKCLKLSIVNLQTRLIRHCHYFSWETSSSSLMMQKSKFETVCNCSRQISIFPLIQSKHIETKIFFISPSVIRILSWHGSFLILDLCYGNDWFSKRAFCLIIFPATCQYNPYSWCIKPVLENTLLSKWKTR